MNAANNWQQLYLSPKHQSLYPMGQSDQAIINAMKLGNTRRNRATTSRPNFNTVWTSPYAAAS